jgi:long-subunit acyl-CoA synthetase (AMP-forming)
MRLCELISGLASKTGSIHTLEQGIPVSYSYATLAADVDRASELLTGWGVSSGTRVGIYATNSYQWLVFDLALINLRAISVPFTDDFAGMVDNDLLDRYHIGLLLLSANHGRFFPDRPRHVAFIDKVNANTQVLSRQCPSEGDEGDQLSLVFSSGSAGGLKGLVISREGAAETLPPIMDAVGVQPGDRMLLFLPMSNFQQRFLCYSALWYDFDIILTDHTQLFPAIAKLAPSILLAPPIFYQMVHADFDKQKSWKKACNRLIGSIISTIPSSHVRRAVARAAFRSFYSQFGDNIRILITGMAPIQRNVGEFFDRMQLPLSEAYGMVEAGVMAFRPGQAKNCDTVGKPVRGVEFHFEDDGEIVVSRNKPLTLRYFQCADGENERTFIAPGKIATGDVGRLNENGELILLGRKKEVIVTAGGNKVHPETIEEELNNLPDVQNSVAFLRQDRAVLVCVICLSKPGDLDVENRVRKVAAGLKSAKKASPLVEVIFADCPFSRENGLLRPNMKIDRKSIVAKYGS